MVFEPVENSIRRLIVLEGLSSNEAESEAHCQRELEELTVGFALNRSHYVLGAA